MVWLLILYVGLVSVVVGGRFYMVYNVGVGRIFWSGGVCAIRYLSLFYVSVR